MADIPSAFLERVACEWVTMREINTRRAQISMCLHCRVMVKGDPATCPVMALGALAAGAAGKGDGDADPR